MFVALAAAMLAAGACTSSHAAKTAPSTTSTTGPVVALQVTGAAMTSGAPLPDPVRAAVLRELDDFIATSFVAPLRTGVGENVARFFTADAATALAGPDRAALVDEGLPAARVTPGASTLVLDGWGDDHEVAVVVAHLDVHLHARTPAAKVEVIHTGELVLVPEGDVWRIDGYDIHTSRDSVDAAATTTITAKREATP